MRRFRDRVKAVDHARRWIADERTGTVWVYDPKGALAYTARASVVIDDPTLSASNHYSVSRTLAGRAERQVKATGDPITLERMLGLVMAPVCWLIGIPWQQAIHAGTLMGIKTVLNEVSGKMTTSHTSSTAAL